PIISLPEQSIYGFEALARWEDDEGPTLPPETFISLAEQTNQIERISALIIGQIGRDLGAWLAESGQRRIAINIAPTELVGSELVAKLDQHLIARGVKPQQILLEITERTMVSGKAAAAAIEALSRRGFRVFADDFGVGYCGLGYLNELHMDGIKISQTFTAALGTDSPKATLVPRIIEMARELDLEIIVEGVENQAQLDALLRAGPLLVQGWLFSREMPARQLLEQYDTLLPDRT
ncbi:MAG: EAL domain-containing protein, partial [Wenzhouxiangella sp.]